MKLFKKVIQRAESIIHLYVEIFQGTAAPTLTMKFIKSAREFTDKYLMKGRAEC